MVIVLASDRICLVDFGGMKLVSRKKPKYETLLYKLQGSTPGKKSRVTMDMAMIASLPPPSLSHTAAATEQINQVGLP